jgi:hypothetical protein
MIFVFGNGLSIGFDRRLTTPAITERVVASLGGTYTGVLRDLAELGTPEDPDTAPVDVDRGGFEQLAGPVDRLADALLAVQNLFIGPGTSPLLGNLREAADGLRQHHVRIVGTVLREVDACCVEGDADEQRRKSWQAMNAFAAELVKHRATMFTLNYDSLLMSALLQQTPYVYDGFRHRSLNVPLDRWTEPALYQLHGSVAWRRAADGVVHKLRLQEVRDDHLLEGWAAGNMDRGLPAVILTDLKTRYTEQYPFSTLYDELHRELSNESLVVVGGYSFGDRPLNRALARFLSRDTHNKLLIWNPTGTRDAYLDRLRKQLLQGERGIGAEQVSVERVSLPDADAPRNLW